MDTELEKVIAEQATKLPKEVRDFFTSSDWDTALDTITNEFSIPETARGAVRNEVVITLLGLMHPDALRVELGKIILTRAETIDAIVAQIENKVLAPIRPALIEFFEKERADAESRGETPEEVSVVSAAKTPSVGAAPANIPTGIKEESLLPPLVPKVITPKIAAPETILMHPFEEKLQRTPVSTPAPVSTPMPSTFTPAVSPAAQIAPQTAPSIPIAPSVPQGAAVFAPVSNGSARGTITHDPYREPVE